MSDEAEVLSRGEQWVGMRLICLLCRAFSRLPNPPPSRRSVVQFDEIEAIFRGSQSRFVTVQSYYGTKLALPDDQPLAIARWSRNLLIHVN